MANKIDRIIKILGNPWHFMMCSQEVEPKLKEVMGFCDWSSHVICIADPNENKDDMNMENPYQIICKVARHEVIHAYLFESGLGDDFMHPASGHEETIIDWFAFQFKKIEKTITIVEQMIGDAMEI